MEQNPNVLITPTKCGKKWTANKSANGNIGVLDATNITAKTDGSILTFWTERLLVFIPIRKFKWVYWHIHGYILDRYYVLLVKKFVGWNLKEKAKNVEREWYLRKCTGITMTTWLAGPSELCQKSPFSWLFWLLSYNICDTHGMNVDFSLFYDRCAWNSVFDTPIRASLKDSVTSVFRHNLRESGNTVITMVTSRGYYIRWHDSATEVFLFVKKIAKTKIQSVLLWSHSQPSLESMLVWIYYWKVVRKIKVVNIYNAYDIGTKELYVNRCPFIYVSHNIVEICYPSNHCLYLFQYNVLKNLLTSSSIFCEKRA